MATGPFYDGWGDQHSLFSVLIPVMILAGMPCEWGSRVKWNLANPRQPGINPFRLKTHLALFPYMQYEGQGVWNLRDDFRQDPSFSHEADNFGVIRPGRSCFSGLPTPERFWKSKVGPEYLISMSRTVRTPLIFPIITWPRWI